MTPLRKRMIDDMRIRNYSPGTIKVYVRLVARFATFHTRSPEDLGPEEIRTYQVHLLDQETSWTIFNQSVCALRFLYRVVLQRDWPLQRLPYGKRAKRLPCVLSQDEVRRLLQAVKRPKQRVALATAYATGLRVSEVTRLRVEDIDSERMLVNVHGKGNKERVVMLSEVLHKLKSLKQGNTVNRRFRSTDRVDEVFLQTKMMEYLYQDGHSYVFMDVETYDQIHLSDEFVGEQMQFVAPNQQLRVKFHEGQPFAVELPASVVLEVTETAPGEKGNSVTNVFKPATLETGLVVKVPLFVDQGQKVKVDTRTGQFIERAN